LGAYLEVLARNCCRDPAPRCHIEILVDGAPYAQEYGCGQTGQVPSDRNGKILHDRRTQSMGKAARCTGIQPNFLVGLRGGLVGDPMYSKGFISLHTPSISS
jgi:hypothetical protein